MAEGRPLQLPPAGLSSSSFSYSKVTKLSHAELRVLAVIPNVLGPFSVIATSFVLLAIYRRKLYKSLYGRLMIGIAGFNTLMMLFWSLGPLPVLESTTGELGARGNTATCTMLGFFLHLGIGSVVFYQSLLIAYFVLIICCGYSERKLCAFEPWVHIFIIVVVALASVSVLILEGFNPLGVGLLVCHIAAYPPLCDQMAHVPCTRGQHAKTLTLVTTVIPGLVNYAVCNGAIIAIYRTAYKRMRESRSRFGALTSFRSFKKMERQTILYALLFFVSNGFPVILPLLDHYLNIVEYEQQMFWVQLVFEILFPLNGVLVFCVFTYSRYEEITRYNSELSRIRALQLTVFSRHDSQTASMMFSPPIQQLEAEQSGAEKAPSSGSVEDVLPREESSPASGQVDDSSKSKIIERSSEISSSSVATKMVNSTPE